MKKVVLLGMLGALTLVSCKKNRTCVCKVSTGYTGSYSQTVFSKKMTKKKAKKECDAYNSTYGGYNDCSLK